MKHVQVAQRPSLDGRLVGFSQNDNLGVLPYETEAL